MCSLDLEAMAMSQRHPISEVRLRGSVCGPTRSAMDDRAERHIVDAERPAVQTFTADLFAWVFLGQLPRSRRQDRPVTFVSLPESSEPYCALPVRPTAGAGQ